MSEAPETQTLSEGEFLVRLEIVTREARQNMRYGTSRDVPASDLKLLAALADRGVFPNSFGQKFKSFTFQALGQNIVILRTK